MRKFKCSVCGYIYDESKGIPEKGIAPGTKWEDIPEDFKCPVCTAPKSVFKPLEETVQKAEVVNADGGNVHSHEFEKLKELSAAEISAICSSLAKGCEKQRLNSEMEAFYKLADYFKSKAESQQGRIFTDISKMIDDDINKGYPAANTTAKAAGDRGALRSLVWSEKVSLMGKALLLRFEKEGDAMLANTKIFVCDVCGFIFLGDAPPDICPVCKVPNYRIIQVERR